MMISTRTIATQMAGHSLTRAITKPSPSPSHFSRSLPLPLLRTRPSTPLSRTLSTTPHLSNSSTPSPPPPSSSDSKVLATYTGPLSRTFTRLKLFSLGSLGLATILTPILLLAPGEISLIGRMGLSLTALATSGVSTALIAWIGTPYVSSMRLVSIASQEPVMELDTVSWNLRARKTLVYEPTFLRPTSRPFASWEITNTPPAITTGGVEGMVEKKIAETFDVKTGKSLGEWIVKYNSEVKQKAEQAGEWKTVGKVEVKGKPTRYFNVHEELLDEHWQVLG
ncbi:hypothetical protein PHSY_004482 [Pseudozyma hubeiensis SY62]|uniref:Uncharacterized protein n=1 Tax=Pseudozyma hubeiensis (strain SY62) TaxID=1305764 RepID=R9P667_PSEHS|nr:hypothetical protein PHSY_004482 [Pseudozyma hubeiensis SY62]GAC96898.1 hypothetical protein PHSY_004482 [Pseudozyma hubeiensis SY62]